MAIIAITLLFIDFNIHPFFINFLIFIFKNNYTYNIILYKIINNDYNKIFINIA
ncbi:Hypothetical protein CFV354_1777 [Campylobacter fetus subsp. venerealis NCTC 10354]|nr:Hypothetical protein CFV354_1777 [Campylobacter fetus subsp. venerealis NCTC 10354]